MTCPRCEEQIIVSPIFMEETKQALAQLSVELFVFCKKNKIDHTDLPALPAIARAIRIIESL